MVCWPFMARHWEGVVFPIDTCYFWAPLGMTPRGGHWQLPESQSWEWGDGRAPPWGPPPALGQVVLSWHLHLLSGLGTCALGCFTLCQPEAEALRGFETPTISVLFRLPGERRRWFLCQGSQTQLLPCAVQGIYTWSWSAMEAVDCIPWGSRPEPVCLTWSLILTTLFCSMEAAGIGFIIVIDRQRDKWSSIKASLTRIAVNIYFCAFFYKSNLRSLSNYFISKSQGKRWLFYAKFWEGLCYVTPISPLPPEGHCREFLSMSKASWVSLLLSLVTEEG